MSAGARYDRTLYCYISWEGKYVCLDTGNEDLSLKPIDWNTIKKCEYS